MEKKSAKVERPDYNAREGYLVVPRCRAEDQRGESPDPAGGHGHYDVVFTLSVPGRDVFAAELVMGEAASRGDSLIAFPDNIYNYEVFLQASDQNFGSIALAKNAGGRLSAATMDVVASSFLEAEKTAYETMASFLSFPTFTSDVGIEIAGYEITERQTGSVKGVRRMLGKTKPFSLPEGYERFSSNETVRRLLAAYRDGMNSTNPFYQALSFSKVIEGMSKLFAQGSSPREPLRFPADIKAIKISPDQTRELFRPFLGKKFGRVRDHFRPVIRHAIAHLDPFSTILDIDHFEDVATCENAIPVLRFMAKSYPAA